MLSLRKPSAKKLRDFLAAQSKLDITNSAVGATATQPSRRLQKRCAKNSVAAMLRAVSP